MHMEEGMRHFICAVMTGMVVMAGTAAKAATVPCQIRWNPGPEYHAATPDGVVHSHYDLRCDRPWTVTINMYTSSGSLLAISGWSNREEYVTETTWTDYGIGVSVGWPGGWQYDRTYTFKLCFETYPNESCTSLQTLTIPPENTSTGDARDLDVYSHTFTEPLIVNDQACGYIELEHTGSGTLQVDAVDINFSGVGATWSDDTDGSDFAITGGATYTVGDPFCFTPLATGTLTVDVRVMLIGGSYGSVDSFPLSVGERPDPCAGWTCGDTCSGETRLTNCVPTASGTTCTCQCATSVDCNNDNHYDPAEEYCAANANPAESDVRSRQRYWDYLCTVPSGCVLDRTEWRNDVLVTDCHYGCSVSGTDASCAGNPCTGVTCPNTCDPGDVRKYNGTTRVSGTTCVCDYTTVDCDLSDTTPVRDEYCEGNERWHRDTWTDYDCAAGVCRDTAMYDDESITTCTYGCQDNGATTVCTAQPCTIVSILWDVTTATEGDPVPFTITFVGSCTVASCTDYEIWERDPWPNPDDLTAGASICLSGGSPTHGSWIATHDDAEVGDSEYDILVFLDDQSVETPEPLIVSPRDPCADITCPAYCDGDIRTYAGTPTPSGDTCSCSYRLEDCNAHDKTNPPEQYCDGSTLRNHRWHNESWCSAASASCTASAYWVEDVLIEDCNGRDNTAAAVPYCRTDVRWSHAWHQNYYCQTNKCDILFEGWILGDLLEYCDAYDTTLTTVEYCRDTDGNGTPEERRAFDTNEDAACIASSGTCDVIATTMVSDRGLQTCAYQCTQTTDTTTTCIPEPCTLISVAWEDSDRCVNAGTTASYTVTARGACTPTDCFDYVVYEDDPEVPIDPFNWFEDTPLDSGSACLLDEASRTLSWLTRNTPPYVDNEEVRVAVQMDDHVSTSEILCVARRDPCLDVECEDFCDSDDVNIRWVARHWVDDSTGRCWCEHDREDCNDLDVPTGERATACREGNVYEYTRYADYTCELGGCTVGSDVWRDESFAESCPAGCTQRDERTAACAPEPCVPDWQHSEWSPPDCSAAAQTRTWWDEACPGSVPYVESSPPCPCALAADGVSWSERDAYEGDVAHLDVAIRGDCTDDYFDYEIREVDFSDDAIEDHDLAGGGRRYLADDEHAGVTIPWNVVYLGPGSMLFSDEHFADGEMGANDMHGFVYHGGAVTSSLETQELNVYPTREPLAEDTEVFLEDLIAAGEFPIPPASLETCFVPGAVSDVVTVAPSPDCALWEHELGVEYLESEEVMSDIIDTVLGDSRRELIWTGGCLACELGGPTLVAIGACEAGTTDLCSFILIPAGVACVAFCGELLETRAVFAGRVVVKEAIEERLASRARALGIAGWDRYDYFIAESGAYAKATYVSPTGESRTLWEFPQVLGDATINDRRIRNSLLTQPDGGGDEVLQAMWRTKERYGRVLVGFDTPNPSPIGSALLARAAREGYFASAIDADMDDLLYALLVDPAVALEDLRYVDETADFYGVTRPPSGGLPPTMRKVRVNLDRIARDFGDDASPILIHVIQPHELGHASINWWSRTRGYHDVTSGPFDEAVDEFFTNHFRWSRASSARRTAFEEWAPRARLRMLDLLSREERNAMIHSFINAVDAGRQPVGDEWDIVGYFADGELFASDPLKEAILHHVDAVSGGRTDIPVRLREYARQLMDDAEIFSGRVASDAPDAIFDDLTCRKYRIYDCLTSGGSATDEAGDPPDGIPGPEDTTDDIGTYDPDDPDGPGHRAPADAPGAKAPGATDGTGCACDARGGADAPLLALTVITLAVRRRRPKRGL